MFPCRCKLSKNDLFKHVLIFATNTWMKRSEHPISSATQITTCIYQHYHCKNDDAMSVTERGNAFVFLVEHNFYTCLIHEVHVRINQHSIAW